ncbi:MAG: hypothetical protein PHH14_05220 [Candidatus Margulisbacteria bacterium]|nr:hypothetical protein [Candidatus Margulisiibacteriota bacterium]
MQIVECPGKKVLPFTVNVTRPEERENLNRLGLEIASKEGLHYEGYAAITIEPYSIEHAKAELYFN